MNVKSRRFLVLSVCLLVGFLLIFSITSIVTALMGNPESKEILDNSNNIIQEDEIVVIEDNNNNDLIEIPQEEVMHMYKATIKSVGDLSLSYVYDISIGMGDHATPSKVTTNINTIYFDFNEKKMCNTSKIMEGSNVVLYAKGNYVAGDLVASLIGLGDDMSYTFGITEMKQDMGNGNYLCTIQGENTILSIGKDCVLINGINGYDIFDYSIVDSNSKILYKYYPDFEITDSGNLYYCSEIIVFGAYE